ncbi:MAG: hypothetical protein IH940_10035, partial [Acidobacteria bacterium]|nr:hypothetical protein [Acidobacteriota bacterium]
MRAVVIVPIKSFDEAKSRLSSSLGAAERQYLAKHCAETVVAAAQPLPVLVACDDDDVATWAVALGATVSWRKGRDLNQTVTDTVAAQRNEFDQVIVAHSDLPLAIALGPLLVGHHRITLVGDRHGEGTNVAVVDPSCGFRFQYGAGSLRRHKIEARRIGTHAR